MIAFAIRNTVTKRFHTGHTLYHDPRGVYGGIFPPSDSSDIDDRQRPRIYWTIGSARSVMSQLNKRAVNYKQTATRRYEIVEIEITEKRVREDHAWQEKRNAANAADGMA